jgi:transposase
VPIYLASHVLSNLKLVVYKLRKSFFGRKLEVEMQAYSQDLRERILRALDRGDRPTEIAQRFEVSRIWVYHVKKRVDLTGNRGSSQIGGYRRSRLAKMEGELCAWIAAEPALTLAEIQQRLTQRGVSIKIGALWHQMNKWSLTFKKNSERKLAKARDRGGHAARMN